MSNVTNSDFAIEHAWKYFELHANQRMTLFNYFLFIMAGLGAAVGATIQGSNSLSYLGIFISFFIILVSIVFWKLDQRTSFLIKQSELVLQNLEQNFPAEIGLFNSEKINLVNINKNKIFINKIITYGLIFRATFFITGLIGAVAIFIFSMKIAGYIFL